MEKRSWKLVKGFSFLIFIMIVMDYTPIGELSLWGRIVVVSILAVVAYTIDTFWGKVKAENSSN